jgi:transposase-like protein
MRVMAAIGWMFGMSYGKCCQYWSGLGVAMSRMSVWRDVQQRAAGLERERLWKPVRVLGLDGAYVRGWGQTQPVLVAVDLGTGEPVTVGYVDEKDPQAVKRFLEPLMQRLGVSVIVTDDLASYKQVADGLGLEQQVCQFHVRRWVGRAVHELKESLPLEWIEVAEEVRQILRDLSIEGDKRLVALLRQFPRSQWTRSGEDFSPLDKLRLLIVRLAENWSRFRVFDWQAGVPWTNNLTEQVIGKMKMRARTVRGYKTWPGMASGLMVSGIGIG